MSSEFVAAIDLGSNSFHMIVARIANGRVEVLDRLREMVQLAAGLDARNHLSLKSQRRALECLARFGQRLRHIPASRVRIVGTNTLRQARNSSEFVARAEQTLGHKVEIVAGQEEARLIHLGVAHSVGEVDGQRLVIDIGGGSTELIIGEKFDPLHLASLRMGCVGISRACFRDGRMTSRRLRQAELLVQLQIEPVREEFLARGWQAVTGASGSIKTIQEVIVGEGWSRDRITLDALRRLRAALLETPDCEAIARRWPMEAGRARVFAGGLVVLHGLCEALAVPELEVAEGALREGLIYDLLGRIRHEDVRDRTIAEVIDRFALDENQANRVRKTALELLRQARARWPLNGRQMRDVLDRAARLHELGLLLTHDQYHKHGAYVLEHSDLPGYSRDDQQLLAALVRRHRRSFPANAFAHLPALWQGPARRLCVLLRLAVVLHRGRSNDALPDLGLRVDQQRLTLTFPAGWLDAHPLTRADLELEAAELRKAGFSLNISPLPLTTAASAQAS